MIGFSHRILEDIESNHEDRRESIRELKNHCRADESRKIRDLGDRGGDDKSQEPVDGHDGDPEVFSLFGLEGRETEHGAAEIGVEDFYADVAVETGGYEAGEEG